jgi:hypothetical protein
VRKIFEVFASGASAHLIDAHGASLDGAAAMQKKEQTDVCSFYFQAAA